MFVSFLNVYEYKNVARNGFFISSLQEILESLDLSPIFQIKLVLFKFHNIIFEFTNPDFNRETFFSYKVI